MTEKESWEEALRLRRQLIAAVLKRTNEIEGFSLELRKSMEILVVDSWEDKIFSESFSTKSIRRIFPIFSSERRLVGKLLWQVDSFRELRRQRWNERDKSMREDGYLANRSVLVKKLEKFLKEQNNDK